MSSEETSQEVIKWYTHVRKFPTLIGRTSDGKRIPGGPYTPTQLLVGAGAAWLMSQTTWVWARFGRMGNITTFLLVVGGLIFGLGKLPIGSRNPLRVLAGSFAAVTRPTGGRYRGSAVAVARPERVRQWAALDPAPAPQQRPSSPSAPSSVLSPVQTALARGRGPNHHPEEIL